MFTDEELEECHGLVNRCLRQGQKLFDVLEPLKDFKCENGAKWTRGNEELLRQVLENWYQYRSDCLLEEEHVYGGKRPKPELTTSPPKPPRGPDSRIKKGFNSCGD